MTQSKDLKMTQAPPQHDFILYTKKFCRELSQVENIPVPTKLTHPEKISEYLHTRQALFKAYKIYTSKSIQSFELEGFHYLKEDLEKNYILSLSHSQKSCAILISKTQNFSSLGVDIEVKTRNIADGMKKYIIHPSDQSDYKLLEIFSIKEAAFKAIYKLDPEIKSLAEINLTSNKFFYRNIVGNILNRSTAQRFIFLALINNKETLK
ncbi:4'-phosphopantetheinyl transferase superfamily protein [bacterium]|nr:4'-phosphopantetheinyl transferase superfamily protein [bacterium]